MKFLLVALVFASSVLLSSMAEETPVGAGDALKVDTTTTADPLNATAVHNPDPVNSEQKLSNLSASKEKPEESLGDKVAGAANDAKESAQKAGQTASDAVAGAVNGASAQSLLSLFSTVLLLAFAAFYTSH